MRLAGAGAVVLLGLPARVLAGPLLAAHPGGIGFFGPTDPEVTAIWWNAAALGELGGTHLHLAGSPTFLSQKMSRASGGPITDRVDLAPDVFIGATTDFTTDHVRVGVAYHIPFRDYGSIGSDADRIDPATHSSPLRYQRLHTFLQNHYFSPAAAFRINSSVSFGIGMNIVYTIAGLSFDRDRPLDTGVDDHENPAQAERIDVNGTAGSVGFQAGFLWRIKGRVTLGGAFVSRAATLSRTSIPADRYGSGELNAHITQPGGGALNGYGEISFKLPDLVHFGARWLVSDRLEAAATFRYADWGQRSDSIRIHMTSQQLRQGQPPAPPEPQEIILYRGYRDSYQVSARGAYCARRPLAAGEPCRLRLGLSAGFDTGMYDPQAVQADALDGPTLELGFLVEWRLSSHLRLVGGGTYAAMMSRQVTASVYDANLALGCVNSGYSAPACTGYDLGQGLPSANGSYNLQTYAASLGMVFDWWGR